MTDREKLLTALLQESERRVGVEISVLDLMAMLEALGAEHRDAVRRRMLRSAAKRTPAGHPSRRVATRSGARSARRTKTAAATERSAAVSGVRA